MIEDGIARARARGHRVRFITLDLPLPPRHDDARAVRRLGPGCGRNCGAPVTRAARKG